VSRSLLIVFVVLMLAPAALGAQASARMKASATVVAAQTVVPQTSAATLAHSVAEQIEHGEQVAVQSMDQMEVADSGVRVSMDVAEQPDLTAPMTERENDGQQVLQVTVAYAGN
jgi:hypothetical protein